LRALGKKGTIIWMKLRMILPALLAGAALYSAFAILKAPSRELKVLMDSSNPPSVYDPVSLGYTRDYFFSENLFSPLTGYSSGNELVSELAEKFEWAGGEAVFTMRPGLKTAGGRSIDAFDAEQSLKRAFVLGGTSYSFLGRMLCGRGSLKSLQDPCPGLEVRDGGRRLVMKFDGPKPFLFHLLTNIAYAVVPRGSVDPATLKITDYRNTSGPYYLDADLGLGDMVLKGNPAHYRYSKKMPRQVRIVSLKKYNTNEESLATLSSGTADYLTIGLVLKPEDKADFAAAHPGYSVHFTRPVRMIYIVFTDRGLKRLSREERFYIASKLRALYPSRRRMNESPYQLFAMEGALSKAQLEDIRARLTGGPDMVIKKRVEARRLYSYFWLDLDEIKKWLPGIAYADTAPLKDRKNPPKPDFFLLGSDIGYQDDIGLVLYYLGLEFFDLSPEGKEKWLAAYVACPGKKERMAMLRELHYKTLAGARAIPIGLMPYASIAREPWEFNYPAAIAGDHLWRLRRK